MSRNVEIFQQCDFHLRRTQERHAFSGAIDNLLLVSYQFPPLGGVGVQRALSFAKFFPECGFQVHVLTPSNGVSHTTDPSLLREIPPSVKVHRILTPELPFSARRRIWQFLGAGKPGRAGAAPAAEAAPPAKPSGKRGLAARLIRGVMFPDPQVMWMFGAAFKAIDIIRQWRIQTVVVTVPPFSTLKLLPAIREACPDTTLVADFRDEWLDYYLRQISPLKDSSLHERAYRTQQKAVEAADLVVAVTESSLRKIRRYHPEQPPGKFAVIPNGYDHTKVLPLPVKVRTGSQIKVVYVGTVYKPCTPSTYLAALDRLPEALRSRFETRFVGRVDDDEKKYLNNCRSKVELLGFLPQNQALHHMEEADYLLLPLTEASVLPGKVYEYMATGKPILALTPGRGELGRLIRHTQAGLCVEHDNLDAIERLLTQLANGEIDRVRPDARRVERYSRLRLTGEYTRLIRRVQGIEAGVVEEIPYTEPIVRAV